MCLKNEAKFVLPAEIFDLKETRVSIKSNFSCKSYNFAYVVIYHGCKEECTVKQELNQKRKWNLTYFLLSRKKGN